MFLTLQCQAKIYEATDPDLQMISGVMVHKNQLLSGIIRQYIPAVSETHLTTFDNGIQHGDFTVIHDSGVLLQKTPFKNGKQNGYSYTWFLNGKNRSFSEFKNGFYVNDRMEWHDNGQLALYEKYTPEGKILGAKKFYREGKIYMNLVFQEDGSSYGLPGSKVCKPIKNSEVNNETN
ncbi:toxin-antitoxin system YwqK family antitoxin [Leptospira ryugenii]|uniref:toxin-antitoxin system YwqK family antitoxin n=1 Tax=Leptospira ryugenii TaxID=1917863 RepID=UPI00107EF6B9|nr:hypothetical protein [Leptospira ryugenii]